MTELLNNISGFLSKSWLPNLVGLVGGLLGLWTFIDNYVIRFRPKIYIGTRVLFHAKQENRFLRLKSIIASLEICNHRKKYGVVYDLALRIYKADEINPDAAIYYSSELCDKVPINIQKSEDIVLTSFNPITVLPSSNKSVNVFFSEILHRSEIEINPSSSYYIEAYYQLKPNGKWRYIDKLYLFNKGYLNDETKDYIQFTALNSDVTREKLKKRVRSQKTNLYKGATHKYLLFLKGNIKYKYFKRPLYRIKDIFTSIPFYSNICIKWLIDNLVRIPIIKKYGKTINKGRVQFGDKKRRPITDKSFEKIFDELSKLASLINKNCTPEAKINVTKQGDKILLSRYKLSITIYRPGDISIYAHELNYGRNSRLNFKLNLRKGVWNRDFWYLDNSGFISIKSFVIKLMDAFIIHSNY